MSTVFADKIKKAVEMNATDGRVKNSVYKTNQLNLWYGDNHALKNIDLDIIENEVTSIIDHQAAVNRHISKL